jgi:hypothetical protein
MTGEWVIAAIAMLFSVLFENFPKLKDWWDAQPYKGWIFLALCLVVPFGAMALVCFAGAAWFACIEPFWPDAVIACLKAAALAFTSGTFVYRVQSAFGIGSRLKRRKFSE